MINNNRYSIIKIIYVAFFSILPLASLHGLDIEISVAYQPFTNWKNVFIGDDYYDYNYDKGQYIVYQSNLQLRSGLSFGFGLGYSSGYNINDNVIGIFSDILAYLGYRQFFVKVANGTIPGNMSKKKSPSYPFIGVENNNFRGELTTVDLIYEGDLFYFGLRYKYLTLPSTTIVDSDGNVIVVDNLWNTNCTAHAELAVFAAS